MPRLWGAVMVLMLLAGRAGATDCCDTYGSPATTCNDSSCPGGFTFQFQCTNVGGIWHPGNICNCDCTTFGFCEGACQSLTPTPTPVLTCCDGLSGGTVCNATLNQTDCTNNSGTFHSDSNQCSGGNGLTGTCIIWTPTITPTKTITPTPTVTPTGNTPTHTETATQTPTATVTHTPQPPICYLASPTLTFTATATPTAEPPSCCNCGAYCFDNYGPGCSGCAKIFNAFCSDTVNGGCINFSPTPTPTSTFTPTQTFTVTPTETPTSTETPTPTITPTFTITPTATFTPACCDAPAGVGTPLAGCGFTTLGLCAAGHTPIGDADCSDTAAGSCRTFTPTPTPTIPPTVKPRACCACPGFTNPDGTVDPTYVSCFEVGYCEGTIVENTVCIDVQIPGSVATIGICVTPTPTPTPPGCCAPAPCGTPGPCTQPIGIGTCPTPFVNFCADALCLNGTHGQ